MNTLTGIWSAEEIRQRYGDFYDRSPQLQLDKGAIPERFWPLIPYAEFWGIADDVTREELVIQAPFEVKRNFRDVITNLNADLNEWLAGPEADNPDPSPEYVAFSAMRMAAYFIRSDYT